MIYGELIDEIGYADTELPQYLRYDNWDIADGLLLLSDLSPEDSEIEPEVVPNDPFFIDRNPYRVPDIKIKFVRPLTADRLFNLIHEEYIRAFDSDKEAASRLGSKFGKDISEKQLTDTINIIRDVQESYKHKFLDLLYVWYSGDHWDRDEVFYSVKGFIQWAKEKNINVSWFDWAKDNILLDDKKPDNKRDVLGQTSEEEEPEIDIDELTVCAENDQEISIKEPKKQKIKFFHIAAGFIRTNTKEWKALKETLTSSPHLYSAGFRYKNKNNYDNRLALLKRINRKLITLISKNFPNVKLPDDGKLYDWCKAEEPGTYKFKFNIVRPKYKRNQLNEANEPNELDPLDYVSKLYDNATQKQLESVLAGLAKDEELGYKNDSDRKAKMDRISKFLREKYGLTSKEITDLLSGRTKDDF